MSTASDSGTLAPALDEWWDDFARSLRRKGRSDRTTHLYRRQYVTFWNWTDHTDPAQVTTAIVNAFTDHLRDSDLKPATVAIAWRNLRPFFGWWAKETGEPNPFDGADNPGNPEDPPPIVDLEDVRALLAACDGRGFEDRRDTAIIRVLFDTGARLGELAGLHVGDWDRRHDHLNLDGKTGMRIVPMSASTGEAMARYVRARAGHPFERRPELWLGKKGALSESGISQLIARRCRQAGLPRLHPHLFRHAFSHHFRDQGGSEGDLMYLAGWTSTAMAHRYGKSAAGSRARASHRRLGLGDML